LLEQPSSNFFVRIRRFASSMRDNGTPPEPTSALRRLLPVDLVDAVPVGDDVRLRTHSDETRRLTPPRWAA
jgi:hypothetical protein